MKELVALIKHFEGLSLKPYICPAGYPTIGYGTLLKNNPFSTPISKLQATILVERDAKNAMAQTIQLCPILAKPENFNKLQAIADFVYNLGAGRLRASTLRRKINAARWKEAEIELQKWVFGGGKKLKGLVKRREAEILLFNSPIQPQNLNKGTQDGQHSTSP